MEITIYHNPRCSKSRQTLEIVDQHAQTKGLHVNIIEYLKTPPSHQQLDSILRGLDMEPRDLMRKREAEYTDNNLADEALSRDQLIALMIEHPKVIERPIVVVGDEVVIGRPPEAVQTILPE